MTVNHLFAAYFHLFLKASLIIAAVVAAGGVLVAGYVFLRSPGTWRQRIRGLLDGGGGT